MRSATFTHVSPPQEKLVLYKFDVLPLQFHETMATSRDGPAVVTVGPVSPDMSAVYAVVDLSGNPLSM